MGFGYPESCVECQGIFTNAPDGVALLGLTVKPCIQKGNSFRLMLIGQDPTIKTKTKCVAKVLMLNDATGQIRRWIEGIFGKVSVYATNAVKCRLSKMPSEIKGGPEILKKCFKNCGKHLKQEISSYKPDLIVSFGEAAHQMTASILDANLPNRMKEAFTGNVHTVNFAGTDIKYTPCLHLKTYKVAESYGAEIVNFKQVIGAITHGQV